VFGTKDVLVIDQLVVRAKAGDDEAFTALVEPHRRELHVHCYRMLGSVQDAEDVLQETLVAAWRGLSGYEGRATVRAWLYRIATNRCLNWLRDGERRPRSVPAQAVPFPEPTRRGEPVWLQPYPDDLLTGLPDTAPGPETRYEQRESISLAFVTAVQSLPPRQRAVLVLRDVLGFRAAEVADMLDMTEDAVTSALRRARAGVSDTDRERTAMSTQERAVAARFADAIEGGDVDALVALLTDDAWMTMPPMPFEYQGPAAIGHFLRTVGFRDGHRGYRLVPTAANGQPAYGCYISDYGDPVWRAHGVMLITVAGDRVATMTRFVDNSVLPYFGLPRTLGDRADDARERGDAQ
jgi:RNA polymerase sigma-70 factor (TIGR02960 family)